MDEFKLDGILKTIHEEGFAKAQEKTDSLIKEAQKEASALLEKTKQDIKNQQQISEKEIARKEDISKKTIEQAASKVILDLKQHMTQYIGAVVEEQIGQKLKNDDFLKDILLTVIKEQEEEITVKVAQEKMSNLVESIKKDLSGEKLTKTFFEKANIKPENVVVHNEKGHFDYDVNKEALCALLMPYLNSYLSGILENLANSKDA